MRPSPLAALLAPPDGPAAAPSGARDAAPPWRVGVVLPDEAATRRLAAALSARLGPGDALLLSGPIGAGKSALARALIRARLGDPALEVPSPSFTLVQTYADETVWHADLHRLTGPSEAVELGLAEAFATALVLVEWPDRLGPLAPAGALSIDLAPDPDDEDRRHATLSGDPAWARRLGGALG